jgi:serine O-acetyltransferase
MSFKKIRHFFLKYLACDIDHKKCKHVEFLHPIGIVCFPKKIGKNVRISKGVTVGSRGKSNDDFPIIGDNVFIGTNACVLGDVTIGNNSKVGALAVVTKDVPPYSLVVGVDKVYVDKYKK